MTANHSNRHTSKAMRKHHAISSILATAGYLLSPLSWWNDLVINIPLAYAFSWPFALLDQRLFLPAFTLGYWLTNLLGFILLHQGISGLLRQHNTRLHWRYHVMVTLLYTAVIMLLVWLQWIPSPAALHNL